MLELEGTLHLGGSHFAHLGGNHFGRPAVAVPMADQAGHFAEVDSLLFIG